jgi:hypothetical protein
MFPPRLRADEASYQQQIEQPSDLTNEARDPDLLFAD